MPEIRERLNIDTSDMTVEYPHISSFPDAQLDSAHNSMKLMSIGGNSIPMRGIHPVEIMSDTDLYRFYPYSAYSDRKWAYTYYTLYNGRR